MNFENYSLEELKIMRTNYKRAYYLTDKPIVSDYEYDSLNKFLEEKGFPETVGFLSEYKNTKEHQYTMLSLGRLNIESDGEFTKTHFEECIKNFKRHSKFDSSLKICWEFKNDGMSAVARYKNGLLDSILTRGDGQYGVDITDKFFHLFPQSVNECITEIRCEIVIPNSVFESKYSTNYSNPRNLASGIKNNDNIHDNRKYDCMACLNDVMVEKDRKVFLVPYTCLKHVTGVSIEGNNIITPKDIITDLDYSSMIKQYSIMKKERENLDIPCDGIVLKLFSEKEFFEFEYNSHEPYNEYVIKFDSKSFITEVTDIVWNPTKDGILRPVIYYKPTVIDGRTQIKADGYNIGWLRSHGLGVGSKVCVEIRGDVIPSIMYVSEKTEFNKEYLPKEYDCYESGLFLYYKDKSLIQKEKFVYGCNKLNIFGFGNVYFKVFADICENDISKLFNPNFVNENLQILQKEIGQKRTEKLQIELDKLKEISILDVIKILGIKGVSDKCAIQVANFYSDLEVDLFNIVRKHFDDATKGESSEKIKRTIEELKKYDIKINYIESKKIETEKTKVVLTGSPKKYGFKTKKEFIEKYDFEDLGKDIKNCDFLITDDKEKITSKTKQALKYDKKIITYGDV